MKAMHYVIACLLWSLSFDGMAALKVVTTTQDLAALVKAVGGDQVEVKSLTAGTSDPHFAVAKPSMIRQVYGADLLLVIGADLEIGWLPPLLQSARNSRVQPGNPGYLDLSTAVPLLGKLAGSVSRAMGDVHAKGNPHYWLDPHNGLRMAQAIAVRLGELDPEHQAVYQQGYAGFSRRLNERLAVWQAQLAPLKGQSVIAYHTSFDYLADAFGFHIADEVEPKPGIAPSVATLSALAGRIQTEHIRLLIMEPYYERRSAEYLSEQTGVKAVVVPQSVGAELSIHDYLDLFDAIVAALTSAEGR